MCQEVILKNFGEVPKWSNGPVLKTGVAQATVGSNPTLSAANKVSEGEGASKLLCLRWDEKAAAMAEFSERSEERRSPRGQA